MASWSLWFMRSRRDGTGEVEIVDTEPPWQIIDFAIDAAGGHIYWTADRNDEPDYAIRRAALDGSDDETLLVRDGQMQSIALDREAEHIYWREETRLMRADFDGSNVLEVLTTTTTERGLALDLAADRIYWRDSGALIRRANLDGSGIEPLYQLPVGAHWFAILPPKVTSTAQEPVSGVTLEQSYPNPATGTATIRFELDDPGHVRLELFDVLGRHIATLAEGPHVHGSHEVVIETGSLAPGTYVYRMSIDGNTAQRSFSIVGR